MPATVVVGLQWGDEGKGKTTDLLAESVAMVVRYQGGDNAGHTVVIGDEVFKLHLVPSGVLHPHITPVIGNGVVVNPRTLLAEMATLRERGIDTSRVRVSRAAHVIMPYHVALDGAAEVAPGRRRDRHHAARHRPRLRRPRLAHRRAHGRPAGSEGPARQARARPAGAQRGAPGDVQPAALRPRDAAGGRRRLGRAAGRPDRRHHAAGPGRARGGPARAAGGRAGDAAGPGPRHLPVRDLAATRSRAAPAPAAASGRSRSTR